MTIAVLNRSKQDYFSLTDIARYRNSQEPFAVINNWMRSRSTIEFLGLREKLCNPDFIPLEFERFVGTDDPDYQKLLGLFEPLRQSLARRPRMDMDPPAPQVPTPSPRFPRNHPQ